MKQIIATTLLSFGLFASAVAQDKTWSLDDCMDYAVNNSPAVKKKAYTHNTYKAERSAAVASFFPAISTNMNAEYDYGRSIDPETNTYANTTVFYNSYGASAQIPIFTGGGLINELLRTRSNAKMGKNDIQKEKDDVALKTMGAYVDVVYYQEMIKKAAEKLTESNRTLYKVRREEELGLKGKADIAQFEAQVAADDYTLTQQQNLFDKSVLTLKQCMNYPSDGVLQVDTAVQSTLNYAQPAENVNEIFDIASVNNPTALQADYQLKDSKYQYRINKGKLLPSIYFRAGISTSYINNLQSETAPTAFGSQFKNNLGEYILFSMSFPLFDGLSRVTNVRRYRNNMRIAEATKTEVLRQLQNEVEQSVLDREGFAKEAIQMDKKVKSEELAYRVTLRKYEEGLMSPIDVQTSANTLLESRATLIQKQLSFLIKCRLVEYYKGKPLVAD